MGTMSGGAMSDSNPHHLSSVSDMKQHLQSLLDSKEKQLEQAATLGQQVLAQRLELEQRIGQLEAAMNEKADEDDIDSEARRRYRDLTDTLGGWDSENAQTSATFGPSSRNANGPASASPAVRLSDLPRDDPDRAKPISTASQSRRAKNAAHRADDVEFAFEIGSGLLTEVRRLQSLLAERDKVIQDMKEEKDDLEKAVESLRNSLRQQEQNADKYKEENWNLEVTLQELRPQLADSQASCLRAEGETKRLTKKLAFSHDTSEQQKNDLEKLQTAYDDLKAKHETDIAQARKHAAGLQRDKSDLQQSMELLKTEQARANRRLPRLGGSPAATNDGPNDFLTPGGPHDDDIFSMGGGSTNRRRADNSLYVPDRFSDYADSSPDASPIKAPRAPNHPSNEIESLQQRLAHAQRQINTLKNTLQREKELKMDYRRKLGASPGMTAPEEDEDADFHEEDTVQAPSVRRPTPYRQRGSRVRGRGRGRGGLTLSERLGMAASSPASEFPDDEDEGFRFDSPPPPVPAINFGVQSLAEREDSTPDEQRVRSPSPSPFDAPSNRTSIDGMDPAFANVLRRTPSANSIPYNSSPLRHPLPNRGGTVGRRNRGGAAFQEARPPSLVGQPDVLAAELGFGSPLKSNESIITEIPVKADFGCQTNTIEEPVAPVVLEAPPKVDSAVQSELPEEPVPVARALVDSSVQTSESPRNDASIQCSPPPIATSSTSVSTDPPSTSSTGVSTESTFTSSTGVLTDPPVVVETSHAGTQVEVFVGQDAQSQTEPAPLLVNAEVQSESLQTGADVSNSSALEDTTVTPTRAVVALPDLDSSDSDGEQTETGMDTDLEPETETDTDDYTDARQSVTSSTPFQSVDDFHSISAHTDDPFMSATPSQSMDDFHSAESYPDDGNDADSDSMLTSREKRTSISSYASSSISIPPHPPSPTYDSKSVSAMIIEPEAPKPELKEILKPEIKEAPKPELKEMSTQTDEWQPQRPVVPPSPAFRIGTTGQQFQFVPATGSSSRTTSMNSTTGLLPNLMRDSPAVSHRTLPGDRRESMDSMVSSMMEQEIPAPADKSKPPTMMLPPPPRMPPPPSAMPPPSFIPEKRDFPPPRPSSPPPPELIQRATTPTFGSVLMLPGSRQPRQSGSSMPPSQQGLRELPSTHSFRSANNAANHAGGLFGPMDRERREFSSTSLNSERSVASPRSSFSSEQHFNLRNNLPKPPTTPDRTATATNTAGLTLSTDPAIIHAITQTMIGEPLYKYVRRPMGGNTRHKRFFWVHPYTKMLYWSDSDPQSSKVSESSAKSAYIEGIRSVLDPNPMPPGLYQYSLIVTTRERELKFTPASKERHDIWLNALRYLLSRANPANVMSPANATIVPRSPPSSNGHFDGDTGRPRVDSSPMSTRSRRSYRRMDSFNTTPRGTRSRSQMSMGKRSGTPAMEYLRWNPESPSKSYEHVQDNNDDDLDFELHEGDAEESFEGLANVRACCDGRHTVGGHHHHHHPVAGDAPQENLRPQFEHTSRPVSPSAWSFRSRAGSSHSRDTPSMFSWGRAEGKLRFGSKRSTKTMPVHDD